MMTLAEQKELKPTYEQLSSLLISGDVKYNMDELIGYLKAIKLTPKWYATNAYNVKYKGKIIFRFSMGSNNHVSLFFTVANKDDLSNVISTLSDDMQTFYFKNLRQCTECNPVHGGGKKVKILNAVYACCAEPEMRINNPTKEDVQYLKRFVPVRKENIQLHIR